MFQSTNVLNAGQKGQVAAESCRDLQLFFCASFGYSRLKFMPENGRDCFLALVFLCLIFRDQ